MSLALPSVLAHLGDVEILSPLHPSRPREVALVKLGDEQYVLKSKAPSKGKARQMAQRLFGHPEIVNEALVYRALARAPSSSFRVPKLVFTDERYFLLLEYVQGRQADATGAERQAIVDALVAFQLTTLGRARSRVQLRQPRGLMFSLYRFVKRLVPVLSRATRRRIVSAAVRMHTQQPLLPRSFTVHHDLNKGNVLIDRQGDVVLLDFAATTTSRRWIYQDIVALASSKGDPSGLDAGMVRAYTETLSSHPEAAGLQHKVQVRAALLVKTLHRILFRRYKKRDNRPYISFLETVLLDDDAYTLWYDGFLRS